MACKTYRFIFLLLGSIAMETKAHEKINKIKEEAQQTMKKYEEICLQKLNANSTNVGNHAKCKLVLCEHESQSAGEMICKAVKENGAEIVVMGTRGLSQFSRSLLGSTSDYVLHNASIPVTIIPPKSE